MSEFIKIEKPEDLSNLVGWSIIKSWLGADGVTPVLHFLLSSPTEDTKVLLKIWPVLTFGRCGNINTTNEALRAKAVDLTEAQARDLIG